MSLDREAARQAGLLRTLWRRAPDDALAGWLQDDGARRATGLGVYRANGQMVAERALAAACPTVRQLLGDDAFAGLARAFWQADPPARGDLAQWGAALADFIAADDQLADLPYLADVARLDWAVHEIEAAADAPQPPPGLQRLAGDDPADLTLALQPGLQLLASRWPLATLWQAHRSDAPDRLAPAREALARGEAETALVWRDGWRGQVEALAPADAAFMAALQTGRPLGAALDAAGEGFGFEAWLLRALRHGWIAEVQAAAAPQQPA